MLIKLFLPLLIFSCDGVVSTNWFEDVLTQLQYILEYGVPSDGVKPLDPVSIDHSFTWNSTKFLGQLQVSGQISGFSEYSVNTASLDRDLNCAMNMNFTSRPNFLGSYVFNATAFYVVPLTGSGTFFLSFNKPTLVLNATLTAANRMFQVDSFDFNFNPEDVQIFLGGFLSEFGLNAVVQEVVEDLVPLLCSKYKADIGPAVSDFVLTKGNKLLRPVDLAKIIELVKSAV